jgi:SAM-dependent methyltransferase
VVLGLDYQVTTRRVDSMYYAALDHAGITSRRVARMSVALRDGKYSADVLERFWTTWEQQVRNHISAARELEQAVVFEGYTLGLPDEVERMRRLVSEVSGEDTPVHRVLVRPSLDDWNRHHRRRVLLKYPDREVPTYEEDFYAQRLADLEPVEGVHDHVVADADGLRELARRHLDLKTFKWYQSLSAGPIKIKGPSDAREKAAAFEHQHVRRRSILDVCCATAMVSMLLKDRGAERVSGVEWKAKAYAKSLELQEVLRRQAKLDSRVTVHHGDAREIVPRLGRFDTVFMFGALHYFEDFEVMLRLVADACEDALYLEFLLPEGSNSWNGEQGLQGYTRASGTTVYAADALSLKDLCTRVMPEFELHGRRPTSGVGRGVDSYREIWTFTRASSTKAT